jgi:phytanoyl-CoA hydroxylase
MDRFIDKRRFEPVTEGSYLSEEQIDSYNRDGILVLRNVIPQHRVDSLKEEALKMFKVDTEWISAPELLSSEVMDHFRSDEFQQPLCDLNGESQIIQGFVYRKKANSDVPKYWHQDGVYWGGDDAKVIAIFTPLTRITHENGVLYIYPGSHKLGRLYHRAASNHNLICDVDCFKAPMPVELFPGDICFMHSHVVHASFSNPSSQDRLSLGFHVHNVNSNVELNQPVIDVYRRLRNEI